MALRFKPLLDRDFLRREFHYEFQEFISTPRDREVRTLLEEWARRAPLGERELEASFIQRFFVELWGYRGPGGDADTWTWQQQFAVPGAGAGGGTGAADLALGHFGEGDPVGQVLCEFKGVDAGLDRPQRRKGDRRSPVQQGLDYLRQARRGYFGNEPMLPRFAVITDMNEFRLYWYDRGTERFLRFRIDGATLLDSDDELTVLLGDTPEAQFDRFLFWRLFRADMLLSNYGRTRIEQLIQRQGARERKLEKDFYTEYRAFRERLIREIALQPSAAAMRGAARVRLAQKLLDRFIFTMFAEDMGLRVAFPPNLLRDLLQRESQDRFFDSADTNIWGRLQRLFQLMDRGGQLREDRIHRFNGGLFESDPDIDALRLPNALFAAAGQGRNAASIEADRDTLLYFAATYNFAAEGDAKNSIGLYTLGHIFEQSIDDLEFLEAEAEDRDSLAELAGKRKRDGVYYTPEPIVQRIVEEVVGPLLARWRAEAGWAEGSDPSLDAVTVYWERLTRITVVDPACGSGAFLIVALRYLLAEFRAVLDLRRQSDGRIAPIDEPGLIAMILANNLHGVDINPASVEITQLSLWLHTARAEQPLSGLDDRIRVGNSLIGPEFGDWADAAGLGADVRARVNAFDWRGAFPAVFARGGFDAVIGNPPYVKLQHFRRVYAETADYLRDEAVGDAAFASTRTGNFDLYLPFVEQGLRLLNDNGRMGYIAPNLWPTLEYGQGLRRVVREGRHLERWLDFRSHQVFEGLTTYTAIQIYSKAPVAGFRIGFAPTGELARIDWQDDDTRVDYAELPADDGPWLLAPAPVRRLIGRLARSCDRLDDPAVTSAIFQGLITSADHIYHLRRLGTGRYLHTPRKVRGVQPPPYEVAIEDAIMKPLVSGAEVKRLIDPETDTHLLFPYRVDDDGARLWTPGEMAERFPRALDYLHSYEPELRARESDGFDDDQWYRFGRSQNIDKQEWPKLVVPRLVVELKVVADADGQWYCDNVDVGGVVPTQLEHLPFLSGVLAAPTTNFLFRWISKPFRGAYLSANRQFIAPLPVPRLDPDARTAIGDVADRLQRGYTRRRRVMAMLDDRLDAAARRRLPPERLLADVRSKAEIEGERPVLMPPGEVRGWADTRYKEQLESAQARIDSAIRPGAAMSARLDEGELIFVVDEVPVARLFVTREQAVFALAQWQIVALRFEPTGKDDGKRLIERLRLIALDADPALVDQIVERQGELARLTDALVAAERDLDDRTAAAFALTPDERRLVANR